MSHKTFSKEQLDEVMILSTSKIMNLWLAGVVETITHHLVSFPSRLASFFFFFFSSAVAPTWAAGRLGGLVYTNISCSEEREEMRGSVWLL